MSRFVHFTHVVTNYLGRRFFPTAKLYISYGLSVWRQTSKTNLNKILLLQKRVLRLIYFSDRKGLYYPIIRTC